MDGKKLPGKWVYGGIFHGTGDHSIIYGWGSDTEQAAKDVAKYPVYSDTVGQYTGLIDKNGAKIFEGDILRCVSILDSANCVVVFEKGEFRLIPDRYYKAYITGGYCAIQCFDKEVIGNIHDNPELLEEEANELEIRSNRKTPGL